MPQAKITLREIITALRDIARKRSSPSAKVLICISTDASVSNEDNKPSQSEKISHPLLPFLENREDEKVYLKHMPVTRMLLVIAPRPVFGTLADRPDLLSDIPALCENFEFTLSE